MGKKSRKLIEGNNRKMKKIYIWIALLAIYGDLLKRLFPPLLALASLYVFAAAILILILFNKRRGHPSHKLSKDGSIIYIISIVLVFLYVFQSLISFSVNIADSVMLALYVITPLLFIIVIGRFYPEFDLAKLAFIFLWMMIPVNMVGIIQYFIDPGFLVSTSYSEEGGVISRNFLNGGSFTRYPSLFASADRYSAMALMHFYFTFVLWNNLVKRTKLRIQWIAFNLVSAILALGIAGARSRILIVMVVLGLALFTYFMGIKSAKQMQKTLKGGAVVSIVAVMSSFVFLFNPKLGDELIESFSVIKMLMQTFETGDVTTRTNEGIALSVFPDDISLFGEGLASESPRGRPGEFAIRAIWKESGIFFGMMMLCSFVGIIVMLARLTFFALKRQLAIQVVMHMVPLILMIFALLAGLSSAFELSTGILLGCAIAVISCKEVIGRNNLIKQDI